MSTTKTNSPTPSAAPLTATPAEVSAHLDTVGLYHYARAVDVQSARIAELEENLRWAMSQLPNSWPSTGKIRTRRLGSKEAQSRLEAGLYEAREALMLIEHLALDAQRMGPPRAEFEGIAKGAAAGRLNATHALHGTSAILAKTEG